LEEALKVVCRRMLEKKTRESLECCKWSFRAQKTRMSCEGSMRTYWQLDQNLTTLIFMPGDFVES
jgi:hypothetical protein